VATAELTFDASPESNSRLDLVHAHLCGLALELSASPTTKVIGLAQCATFLELMHILQPKSDQIVAALAQMRPVMLKYHKDDNLIGNLHVSFNKALQTRLAKDSGNFHVKDEFHGLKSGIYPVDTAVYHGDKLVALIEVDGPHHFTPEGTLKRKDLLKRHLYKHAYPGVLYLRVKNEMILRDGEETVAEWFAEKINKKCRDLQL